LSLYAALSSHHRFDSPPQPETTHGRAGGIFILSHALLELFPAICSRAPSASGNADAELAEACQWYARQGEDLDMEFMECIVDALSRIVRDTLSKIY